MVSLHRLPKWCEWSSHSNFSFLLGASHPKELVDTAAQHGYHSIALNDYDGVYGLARFHLSQAKKIENQPLKLIYGAEIHLTADHDIPVLLQDTIILQAMTQRGYAQLCHILSLAHKIHGKNNAFIELEQLLAQPCSDLIAIQPMRGLIRQPQGKNALMNKIDYLKQAFKNEFYLMLSRHLHPSEDHWIKPSLDLAKKMQLNCLLSQDAFFAQPTKKPLSDILHGIRHNTAIDKIPHQLFVNSRRCLHHPHMLYKIYNKIPNYQDYWLNSYEITKKVSFDLSQLSYQYPSEFYPKELSAQAYLENLTHQGACQIFPQGVPSSISILLDKELNLIHELGFADYFLTVYDIVRWARQKEILCQGRGSAANSAVCYCLGITSINPSQFDLLFERFLNHERKDPPDIDVDFEHERREEVIQYIYQRYGRHRAAMVANVICFKSRGCLRYVAKSLGIDESAIKATSSLLERRTYRSSPFIKAIEQAQKEESHAFKNTPSELLVLWGNCASALKGFPRHLGIHSGGFILSQNNLNQICHQEPATMLGRTIICWAKEDIEGLGFFKIDVLALGMLSAIRKCFAMIKTHKGLLLSLENIPNDDQQTYQMIQQADTIGVFQIESRAQMSFLPKHKPKNFYDLVVQVAIIRPGPIQGGLIGPYLKRRHGQELTTFAHPSLKTTLNRTFGIPIFQEQVMRIAMTVGDFTSGQADELRRQIGSFQFKGDINPWTAKLRQGMEKKGIAADFIEAMIEQMKAFSSYGFPESHAASFALLAYASSYLKCHHPEAFYAALLNSQPMGFYDPDSLLRTAKRLGVQILPICVLHSTWDHNLERMEPNVLAIRLGFRLIRGLSQKGALKLISTRSHRKRAWKNLREFIQTTQLNKVDLTALAAANSLALLGCDRKAALWLAEALPLTGLIENESEGTAPLRIESELESVQLDYRAFSTSLGRHPSELMREKAWVFPIAPQQLTPSEYVKHSKPGSYIYAFGMVTCRQAPPTAGGVMFITLWDEKGTFDVIVKPKIYEQHQQLINSQAFLCIRAKVQADRGGLSLLLLSVIEPINTQGELIKLTPEPLYQKSSELIETRNYR